MKSTALFTIFFLSVSFISGDILPASYDWRDYIRLSPVGDQGNCTAFYAFTTATLTEAAHAIYYNQQDFVLSKQQLVDCTNRANNPITPNYNFGCAGGSIGPAFQYLISHGVVEEKYYPYVDNDKGSCKASSLFFLPSYKITGYEGLPTNTNDTAIMDAIFTKGPVLAYIYSNNKVFKNYSGGIIRNLFPNSTFFDHAIVIVGWGTSSDGVDYWILRNSWSTNWGEQGYARLERHHGLIGINQYVYYVKM